MRLSILTSFSGLFNLILGCAVAFAANTSPNFSTNRLDAGNIRATGNILSTTNANGDLTITPNGTGSTIFSTLTATTVPYLDASKKLTSSAITPTQLALLGSATATNTNSTLVLRDGSGNFAATTITGALTGNATNITGIAAIANGGTGQATKAAGFDALAPCTSGGGGLISYGSGTNTCLTTSIGDLGKPLVSSGALSANTYAILGVVGGGTGLGTLTTGNVILGAGTSTPTFVAPGSSGNVLTSNGTTWTSGAVAGSSIPTTIQTLISGTTYNKDYYFTITSGNATVAATYTNNGVTFTVHATVASSTSVVMSGNGPPAGSGTLTKASGTGDATLTFSAFNAPVKLHILMAGGGAGATGSGTGAGGATTAGNNSTWSSYATAAGGGIGSWGFGGGTGGACTLTSPAEGFGVTGGQGASGGAGAAGTRYTGGFGGMTPFFGGGANSSYYSQNGADGVANTGGGGQGGGNSAVLNNISGSGGGSGALCDFWVPAPLSATYAYVIGGTAAGGTGGAGTGVAGGAGAAGKIVVEEYY